MWAILIYLPLKQFQQSDQRLSKPWKHGQKGFFSDDVQEKESPIKSISLWCQSICQHHMDDKSTLMYMCSQQPTQTAILMHYYANLPLPLKGQHTIIILLTERPSQRAATWEAVWETDIKQMKPSTQRGATLPQRLKNNFIFKLPGLKRRQRVETSGWERPRRSLRIQFIHRRSGGPDGGGFKSSVDKSVQGG